MATEKAVEKKFREWELRFSKLHERRVEVMEGLQERIVRIQQALDAARGIQPLDDPHGLRHLKEAARAGNEVQRFFSARRYYLPKELANKVDRLLTELKTAHGHMAHGAEGKAEGQTSPVYDGFLQTGREAVRERLPTLIAEVEDEFRRLVEG